MDNEDNYVKRMFLFRGEEGLTYSDFHSRIMDAARRAAAAHPQARVKLTLTEKAPPAVSIIPFKRSKVGVISVCFREGEAAPDLHEVSGLAGVYEVEEALPVAYEKNWADGEVTPGVCLLTLFRKKKSIDYDTFIDRWHNSHTPLSLKLHPLWNYSRNVVRSAVKSDSQHWDGIVEEQVRKRADLLNPFRFFGHPLMIIPNMIRVYVDTKSFLDYPSIEPYLVMEYHISS